MWTISHFVYLRNFSSLHRVGDYISITIKRRRRLELRTCAFVRDETGAFTGAEAIDKISLNLPNLARVERKTKHKCRMQMNDVAPGEQHVDSVPIHLVRL